MIKNLSVSNFKAWQSLDINLANITGLFGTNSSGKSSILQFLMMLKQTKEATDRALVLDLGDRKSYVNLGSFDDVVFGHKASQMEWSLTWSLLKNLRESDPMKSSRSILFDLSEMFIHSKVIKSRPGYETESLSYGYVDSDDDTIEYSLAKEDDTYSLSTSGDYSFVRNPGRVWNLPGPIKSYGFPDQVQTYFKNTAFLSRFVAEYEQLMDRIYYLGPLREHPQREYTWAGARPIDVGMRGEKVVDAILAALSHGELRNFSKKGHYHAFDSFVAIWLKQLGLIHDFRVEEIAKGSGLYRVKVQKAKSSSQVYITDVGFGVSQVLPVIVLLFYVPKNSIVLLEQPEIHLHPAVQSSLADLIISAVQTRNIQVILESHSEHLLRRLQLRVAEGAICNNDLALFFCESGEGSSTANPLAVDEYGQISNWPHDFFGDAFGEIANAQRARLLRQIKRP